MVKKLLNKVQIASLIKTLSACLFSTVLAVPTVANAQALACSTDEIQQLFEIPAGSWVAGTTGPVSYVVGAGVNATTFTFEIIPSAPFVDNTPDQILDGNIPNVVRGRLQSDLTNALLATTRISFSRPVNRFSMVSTDVDRGLWEDAVVLRANGTIVPTTLVGGPGHTIDLATGTAIATSGGNCGSNDSACNVLSQWNTSGISVITQEFRTGPNHLGSAQHTGTATYSWCAPRRSEITLRKSWVNATVNNAVTVSATGLTNLLSVANTATEIDTGAVQIVNVGNVLTLAENFTTGSAANYNTTVACTGTSGLSGSTLTVGDADTAIVCTYTNTLRQAAITLTKTDVKSVTSSGSTNTYTVTVSNAGPFAANGIILSDVVGAGLTCPGTNVVTCSGAVNGAVCPAAPLTIANLTGAGITVATLPVTGALQFAYTCNVN